MVASPLATSGSGRVGGQKLDLLRPEASGDGQIPTQVAGAKQVAVNKSPPKSCRSCRCCILIGNHRGQVSYGGQVKLGATNELVVVDAIEN